jgi:hypothetical protein
MAYPPMFTLQFKASAIRPTTPTHFSVVAKREITVYQQLSLCWVKP